MREDREPGGAPQGRVQALIDRRDDRAESSRSPAARRARIEVSRWRRWWTSARTKRRGSLTGPPWPGQIDRLVAALSFSREAMNARHRTVRRRDHRCRPGHDMIGREQGARSSGRAKARWFAMCPGVSTAAEAASLHPRPSRRRAARSGRVVEIGARRRGRDSPRRRRVRAPAGAARNRKLARRCAACSGARGRGVVAMGVRDEDVR